MKTIKEMRERLIKGFDEALTPKNSHALCNLFDVTGCDDINCSECPFDSIEDLEQALSEEPESDRDWDSVNKAEKEDSDD